ncbi:unnamed protein product [Diatraea saccharalis]|uniref:Uncharacterized protein n=1 Tax=Diatraea saccharalis TaxID=40085 RepID=A0A9N9WD44_9NEOP|nr:unnamed protein product [Diatraea saccharalis]
MLMIIYTTFILISLHQLIVFRYTRHWLVRHSSIFFTGRIRIETYDKRSLTKKYTFFSDIVLSECRNNPIEVFEIKETNERHPRLYVKNVDDLENLQDVTLLAKLLRPYQKEKESVVDKVTRNLFDQLPSIKRKKTRNNNRRPIYIIDLNSLNSLYGKNEEIDTSFSDETRSSNPVISQLLNQL